MWPFTKKRSASKTIASNDSNLTIMGRVRTLVRANIHAMLDEAEDPEKLLNELVRNYKAGIVDARNAVQEVISNQRLIEAQQAKDEASIDDWQNKAELAAARAKKLTLDALMGRSAATTNQIERGAS